MIFSALPLLRWSGSALAVAFLFASVSLFAEDHLVVVFPGGPKPGSSGQRVIDDFVGQIEADLKGSYFNETEKALAFLRENPNSFILGSTGFFLQAREELKLEPMLRVVLPNEKPEQYFLVSKKGSFSSLADLEGKTVVGTPFHESAQFVEKVVFNGKVPSGFWTAEATERPLSALRKLTSGDIDAVLLAAPQYHGLAELPLADELDVVFESRPVPSVGLMRVANDATAAKANALKEAMLTLSQTPEGAEAAKGFGVAGFAEIEEEKIQSLIQLYDPS